MIKHAQTLDFIAEMRLIETSQFQRELMKEMAYSHTTRRLVTDAKIVLERAGYDNTHIAGNKQWLYVCTSKPYECHAKLPIKGGTVDNERVVELLAAKGFNAFGHKRMSA